MSTVVNPASTGPTSSGLERDARRIHDDKPISPGSIALGVIIGRMSEFFDFFVYGLGSVLVFPKLIFPFAPTPVAATLMSFAIFPLAFMARPVGSFVFMWIDRNYGRGTKLTIALFLLGGSTASIAFLPGYDAIGYWAVALLALFRMGQGFALGGAWDGLASLLNLNAPPNRRGWYAMIPQLGAPIGFALASILFGYFVANLSEADFISWGWRYPFFVAFAINVVALFARLRIVASKEFGSALEANELQARPIFEMLSKHAHDVVLGAFVPLASFAMFHLVTIFPLSWVTLYGGQSAAEFLFVQVLGAAVGIVGIILSGLIADRIGRRSQLMIGAVIIAIFSFSAPFLLDAGGKGQDAFIIIGFGILGLSFGQASGAVSSRFGQYYRYTGAALTSDLAWLVGAGFAPLVALGLASSFGIIFIGGYLISGAICTIAALSLSRVLDQSGEPGQGR
ncbi:MFS transporter [Neorhizobium galegae]|uniref:MFS transporter n=1 Tax=Neorhizobium galegae TaxID=399 RepID=UPI000621DD7D|nr:MFS transporter [Neorhizobium galegae]CDZ26984.1 MFS transporter, metabolite:H+ symporter (MHS) family protein [Neorhizobium galegae bv. officinalis]KAA9383327.1 MHS family MFS transporter [Neorhizobium galegae]KAB1111495.1 MHS family MFS transporter [Neorhizobium galegae]MCM2500331.1 MFS transporter [Neorhizobium galegae]MCQ1767950.1 MFS transporter [Neorhizobium galegae]